MIKRGGTSYGGKGKRIKCCFHPYTPVTPSSLAYKVKRGKPVSFAPLPLPLTPPLPPRFTLSPSYTLTRLSLITLPLHLALLPLDLPTPYPPALQFAPLFTLPIYTLLSRQRLVQFSYIPYFGRHCAVNIFQPFLTLFSATRYRK